MLLYLFIIFFFILYTILECSKYSTRSYIKGTSEKKQYHTSVVYLKMATICIVFVLTIVNRFTRAGIVERSSKFSVFYIIILLFIGVSIFDVYKVKKMNTGKEKENEEDFS